MDGRNFNLSQGANGEWIVAGRMSVIDCRQCTKNPAAGLSSFPLATLQGTAALAGKPAAVASGQIELHTGELGLLRRTRPDRRQGLPSEV